MDKVATENLFLLEFLVDSIDIGKKCECDTPPGEKCVSFQFLDNAPLDVCEADFAPTDDTVKSGKSCLFSLSPDQVQECLAKFDLLVTIHKKMQPGWLPEKVDLGVSLISIANLFAELVEGVASAEGAAPTAKTLKDVFDVASPAGDGAAPLGRIGVYIRMSCFGKLIVTQFQMNLQDKSVLFKDKEGKSLYRYKKAGKGREKSDKCNTRTPTQNAQQSYNRDCPTAPCYPAQQAPAQTPADVNCPSSPCPLDLDRYRTQAPCNECGATPNAPCLSRGDAYVGAPAPQAMTPCVECGGLPYAPCLPPAADYARQRPNTPEGNYQEIGAAMGGNSLTIRVHKDKNKIEQVDGEGSVASSDCACAPGRPGQKRRGQQFSMGGQEPPFSFRMGGRADDRSGNNVVVNPPVSTAADGTKYTEFSDPDKEMFVLRIGKKSEGVDKKQNLELELCTPKGPELKPIPKHETRETQYDELDAGPDVGEGGKKGGKAKGKGKKK